MRWRTLLALVFATLTVSLGVSSASAAGTVGWTIHAVSQPARFSSGDAVACESHHECDRYQVLAMNAGDVPSSGPIVLTDTLPPGIGTLHKPEAEGGWSCTEGAGNTTVTCILEESVPAGGYAFPITIAVSAPSAALSGPLKNEVSITGGGTAAVVSTSEETPIGSQAPSFGLTEFGFEAAELSGAASGQAGGHPWEVTTSLELPTAAVPAAEPGEPFGPIESWKDAVVELPVGLVGDPQATAKCTLPQLDESNISLCPARSAVGSVAVIAGGFEDKFAVAKDEVVSALYNMVPEGGYPAEFGFSVFGVPIIMYANVVHTGSGYRLRVTVPGIPDLVKVFGGVFTFYGEPGKVEEGGSSEAAFLSNPTRCTSEPQTARAEVESWGDPGHPVSREATVYSQLTGCDLLQFGASLAFAPSVGPEGSSQAGEPSGFATDLKVPQTSSFSELATPELRSVTVALPEGMSVSPSAADGLVGCSDAQIDLASTGLGSCPSASQVGTVKIVTPLLASPLEGQVFVGSPECSPCTAADARDGRMVRLFIQAQGPGFVIKIPGSVSLDPVTGRLMASFRETPQLPFSDLRLSLKGGPRAPLVNPQSCGQASTVSTLESWGAPVTPAAISSSSFEVTGCGDPNVFSPSFTAGTTDPVAGALSPFTTTFSRTDQDQDLSGIQVTLPPGLLGTLSSVPLCGEPQAGRGECSSASEIGHATVGVGAGSEPIYLPVAGQPPNPVYLTTGYKGAPFGLSVVVPAVAGPFNLGDVVVRAAISVDPHTSQVTIVSDPFPRMLDGVPLHIKTVNVTIDRPGFTFNPTNCEALKIAATILSTQGVSAALSSPFQATSCASLPFKPGFGAFTQAKTSKADGASLTVKVSEKPGEANIRKVDLRLPKALPARLSTLQQACTAAQFEANPAGCPAGSVIGTATAHTPVLGAPLTGPAYLVSHGGAAFPDVEFVLQADERGGDVEIILDGQTDIKNGITYSKFETVPDAPISSFETVLPVGPHSVLGTDIPAKAKNSLCGQSLSMPTRIIGQNGAVLTQATKIAVTGCVKAKALTRAQKLAKALRTCRKKPKGAKRASCEKLARETYGPIKNKSKKKK